MGRDTIRLENAVSTISQEYLLEFTSEYGIPEGMHPELPGLEETIVKFLEGKVDEKIFPTVVDWRTNAPKDEMPTVNSYSAADVTVLDTHQMKDAAVASESSETPSTIEKSLLDFANEDPPQTITERGETEDRVQDEVAYEILQQEMHRPRGSL
ncbi:hypothetical protein Tco_1041733 [Tanacetum coccineum]|uniref:Uncharacterized protein n=1 Tax=Tanacetum coccineum TaxID=301880 RepID=A0ABQ5GJL8_9ASTR